MNESKVEKIKDLLNQIKAEAFEVNLSVVGGIPSAENIRDYVLDIEKILEGEE